MSNSCGCCQTKGMLSMRERIILMLQQIKYKIRIAKDSCQGRNTTDQDQQKSEELRSCFPIQSSSFFSTAVGHCIIQVHRQCCK